MKVISLCVVLSGCAVNAQASPLLPVNLATAGSFSVLAGQAVLNTGPTTLGGNLGVSPGSSVAGFPPGLVLPPGTIHAADAVAAQAQSELTAAYNDAVSRTCNFNKTGVDLGGQTLVAGVYCFSSSAQLTGGVVLNGQNDPNAVFLFQIASTLTTTNASSVTLINGARPGGVFWQVGGLSATIGSNSTFVGDILALRSISLQTGATLDGCALSRNGIVTLDTNAITTCGTFSPGPAPESAPVPEPASLLLLGTGLVGSGVRRWRKRHEVA